MTTAVNKLKQKIVLIPLLLLALWLLVDDETSSLSEENDNRYQRRHHLAVFTALRRHPPCLRIYRSLLEFDLMLWGFALSMILWRRTIGEKMIGYLLFQPADHDQTKYTAVYFTESSLGKYRPLEANNNDDENEESEKNNIELSSLNTRIQNLEVKDEKINDTIGKKVINKENDNTSYVHEEEDEIEDEEDINQNDFEQISPPCPIMISHAALDFLVLILVTLFLFTISSAEGGRYVDGMESLQKLQKFQFISQMAAPVFPLALFLIFLLALVVPWKTKRRSQWRILSYTIGAPMYRVSFRDGFIGDILTSSVRPLQDVAFTIFYLVSGLQGWWTQSYDLDAADLPLESNWILHTMILPTCMMSPLWYRFMQNIRQTYDNKCRWPYLGNAFKYFIAAEIGVVGVYMQSRRQSTTWLVAFTLATMYQIWWDVFMDWDLLRVGRWSTIPIKISKRRTLNLYIPTSLHLRKNRIYSVSWMYWSIFGINIILRFCWTLSFLPPHYLNRAGVLSETFDGGVSMVLNPTIASAEIVRRMIWGWIRVENEAIIVARREPRLKGAWSDHYDENNNNNYNKYNNNTISESDPDFKVMTINDNLSDDSENELISPPSSSSSSPLSKGLWMPRKMYDMTEIQILGELCVYATIFTALGLIAAAHRETF